MKRPLLPWRTAYCRSIVGSRCLSTWRIICVVQLSEQTHSQLLLSLPMLRRVNLIAI